MKKLVRVGEMCRGAADASAVIKANHCKKDISGASNRINFGLIKVNWWAFYYSHPEILQKVFFNCVLHCEQSMKIGSPYNLEKRLFLSVVSTLKSLAYVLIVSKYLAANRKNFGSWGKSTLIEKNSGSFRHFM